MTIAREEIFGPVLSIIPYDTEEEAIEIANDTPYGLSGGVWSSDPARAEKVARQMRTGQVDINGGAFNPGRALRRLQAIWQWPRTRQVWPRGVRRDQGDAALTEAPPGPRPAQGGGTMVRACEPAGSRAPSTSEVLGDRGSRASSKKRVVSSRMAAAAGVAPTKEPRWSPPCSTISAFDDVRASWNKMGVERAEAVLVVRPDRREERCGRGTDGVGRHARRQLAGHAHDGAHPRVRVGRIECQQRDIRAAVGVAGHGDPRAVDRHGVAVQQ